MSLGKISVTEALASLLIECQVRTDRILQCVSTREKTLKLFLQDKELINFLQKELHSIHDSFQKLKEAVVTILTDPEESLVSAISVIFRERLKEARRSLQSIESKANQGTPPFAIWKDRDNCLTWNKQIHSLFEKPKPFRVAPTWQELRVQEEQTLISANGDFSQLLKELGALVKKDFFQQNVTVFIAYAYPSPHRPYENWVQPFLTQLYDHLQAVGVTVHLDLKDSHHGHNIFTHMNQLRDMDHALLIGTESLLDKHLNSDFRAMKTELNLIRDEIGKEGFAIPFLLSGTIEESFPEDFRRYSAIESFIDPTSLQQESYPSIIKRLLENLFKVPSQGEAKESWEKVWSGFKEQNPHLWKGLSKENALTQNEQKLEQERLEQAEFEKSWSLLLDRKFIK